jgi:hypothetical protein
MGTFAVIQKTVWNRTSATITIFGTLHPRFATGYTTMFFTFGL